MHAMEDDSGSQGDYPSAHLGRLLMIDEVADRLNVTARFVRRLVAERRIRYFKIGRHVRIAECDVDAWIRGCCIEPSGRRTI